MQYLPNTGVGLKPDLQLGLFIALIVVNCAILGRAEAFAAKSTVAASAADGLMMGLGFTGALVVIGAVREVIGSGTPFTQASLLLGQGMAFLELTLIPGYRGFLLAILPPEIDLSTQAVGIFGKIVNLDARVSDGDRVEIYRPITADPETVERRDTD